MAITRLPGKSSNKKSMETSVIAATAPAPTLQPKSLDELYDLLEQTQPGSEQSLRISEQIIDAIG